MGVVPGENQNGSDDCHYHFERFDIGEQQVDQPDKPLIDRGLVIASAVLLIEFLHQLAFFGFNFI